MFARQKSKFKVIIGWTVSLLLLATLTVLSVQRKSKSLVESLRIEIIQQEGNRSLITKEEIARKINAYLGYSLKQAAIGDLNLLEMEEVLAADERIDSVDVFIDARNRVNVIIRERKVIVRIQSNDVSYYLDEKGNKVSVRVGRAVRVPLATGRIEPYDRRLVMGKERSNLGDIFQLAQYLQKDEFLSALIEQLDIDAGGKVSMVPKIGKERINLTVEELEDKMFKLKYFYRDGLPKMGWSKYSILDLDIRDQVVATLKNAN